MQDERLKIDRMLEVVYLHFKRSSDRLFKLVIQQKAIEAGKLSVP